MSIALQDLLIADRPEVPLLPPGPRRDRTGSDSPAPSETSAKELYFRLTADDLKNCTDQVAGNDLNTIQLSRQFRIGGDYIFCEDVDGGASWGVKLGDALNPIIPIRAGRTINKRFRSFTLYCTQPAPTFCGIQNDSLGSTLPTYVVLYVSSGEKPLIVDAPRDTGKGFGSRTIGFIDAIATVNARPVTADMNPPPISPFMLAQPRPGRRGATLMIRNSDTGIQELLIGQQSGRVAAPELIQIMYRLYPGESLTLDLDGSIQHSFNDYGTLGNLDFGLDVVAGLVVLTAVGTCKYDWMISRMSYNGAPGLVAENQDQLNYG